MRDALPGRPVVGCCGFSSARSAYFERLPAVEVQQTFYQPPRATTLARWREEAPPGFVFAVKAWQLVTHTASSPTYRRLRRPLTDAERAEAGSFRPTETVEAAWAATEASAGALGAAVVLLQCPPSFGPTERHVADLQAFVRSRARTGFELAWEPRGGWPRDLVEDLCDDLDLWHVVDPFVEETLTPDRPYYRLHGRGGWRYQYEDGELEELAALLPAGAASFVFFNNVYMVEDAVRFRSIVGETG
ncbi:MAG TPA: DUF72 domain-containing protein [Rubricoccaceae bacterium]|jgi:uncharacterized protein YecE (DUF72 family)